MQKEGWEGGKDRYTGWKLPVSDQQKYEYLAFETQNWAGLLI